MEKVKSLVSVRWVVGIVNIISLIGLFIWNYCKYLSVNDKIMSISDLIDLGDYIPQAIVVLVFLAITVFFILLQIVMNLLVCRSKKSKGIVLIVFGVLLAILEYITFNIRYYTDEPLLLYVTMFLWIAFSIVIAVISILISTENKKA